MIPTPMILHQWLRINGMISQDARIYTTCRVVRDNEPLLTPRVNGVVAEVTTL